MTDNSSRRTRQKELDIRVIMGNPPYSVGQGSENDNSGNIEYLKLDSRINETYSALSLRKGGKRSLYDSYIRAIRWASDKIGDAGVVAYVSNAGWLDGNAMDGLRRCLADEFANIYIFHLRGNARTQGLQRQKEKDNVFGQGTRTPVAIAVLVKNPNSTTRGQIKFHDIGDYLSIKDKLAAITHFGSINGIEKANLWQQVVPDEHYDWINQRDQSFDQFIQLVDKKDPLASALFHTTTFGVVTARDFWAYNFSNRALSVNMSRMISFYNFEVDRFRSASLTSSLSVDDFVNPDPTKISWGVNMKGGVKKGLNRQFDDSRLFLSVYRPFTKSWLYADPNFVHSLYSTNQIFPAIDAQNRMISMTGVGAGGDFSVMMIDAIPNFHTMATGQCFPRYLYEDGQVGALFANGGSPTERRDALTDVGLAHFREVYLDEKITKDDIFYYVYGLLHSEDYRTRYADNLSKQLPRIPCVKSASDFWAFVNAGRALGEMHVNFETYEPYPIEIKQGNLDLAVIDDPVKYFRVEKMKYGGKVGDRDKTQIIYNDRITIQNIPVEAYDYVVNGKPAIDWVVERQCVKPDKDSGIVNDANDYANETMNNPRYPLELLARVINISLETMKIVRSLPPLGDLS